MFVSSDLGVDLLELIEAKSKQAKEDIEDESIYEVIMGTAKGQDIC